MSRYNNKTFSEGHNTMYDIKKREFKAKKMIAILNDYYKGNTKHLSILDIGCSTGIISNLLSQYFKNVTGIDIDKKAINFANNQYKSDTTQFQVQDATNLKFEDNTFDIVICAHIYEHTSNANKLLAEIHRVLKLNGVCFFAAGNRLKFIEGHYKIPMLSIMPKCLAHYYLRALKKDKYYEENHLTFWGLKKLVSKFKIIDYTKKIIENPQQYNSTDMIKDGSLKQKIILIVLKKFYWICPTYIWLLQKK